MDSTPLPQSTHKLPCGSWLHSGKLRWRFTLVIVSTSTEFDQLCPRLSRFSWRLVGHPAYLKWNKNYCSKQTWHSYVLRIQKEARRVKNFFVYNKSFHADYEKRQHYPNRIHHPKKKFAITQREQDPPTEGCYWILKKLHYHQNPT